MPKLKHLTAKEREKLLKKAMLPSSDELGEEEKQSSSSAITIKIKVDTSELEAALTKLQELKLPSFQTAEGVILPETGILEIQPENKITLNFKSIYDWTKDVDSAMTIIDRFKEKYPDIGIDVVMNFSRTDKF